MTIALIVLGAIFVLAVVYRAGVKRGRAEGIVFALTGFGSDDEPTSDFIAAQQQAGAEGRQ